MSTKHDDDHSTALTRIIGYATGALGSFPAIIFSVALVSLWLIGGLFVAKGFGNNTYQLLINTTTTIITFMMVFIIQNTQNRDGRAMQTKLDAQSQILAALAQHFGLDHEGDVAELLEVVGVEDAPERAIKREQDKVRAENSRT